MAKKYIPKVGDTISFYHGNKDKHTGRIVWIGSATVSVYPHSIKVTGVDKKPIETDWSVFFKNIIGVTKDV
jgi:hypothetical protein